MENTFSSITKTFVTKLSRQPGAFSGDPLVQARKSRLVPRDNEQWDEQIRIAERLGEDPRKMEFEAFARQPQKREERKKLFTSGGVASHLLGEKAPSYRF